MDPHNLQALVAEEERIGSKLVEPTFASPTSACAKYGERERSGLNGRTDLQTTEDSGTSPGGHQEQMQATSPEPRRPHSQRPGANPRTKLIAFVKLIEGRPTPVRPYRSLHRSRRHQKSQPHRLIPGRS